MSGIPEIQHFVILEGELAEMHRTLSSGGSRRVVVLHSLGGIGQTHAKRYRDGYFAVLWLNIKDKMSI